MFKKLLLFKFIPTNTDAGLLALRIIVSISIYLKHGNEKLFHFSQTAANMANRHHYMVAIGVTPNVLLAALADGICTALILVGFATRWAALYTLGVLLTAWGVAIQFAYFNDSATGSATHGEMIVAYSAALLLLVFTGGGKYSIDRLLDK